MEKILEIYKSSVPLEAKRGLVDKSLNEKIVKLLSNEELKALIRSSLNYFALELPQDEEAKVLVSYVINLLHLHRSTDVEVITSNFTKEILSDEAENLGESLGIIRRLFSIEIVGKLVSSEVSQNILLLTKRLQAQGSLPALAYLAAIINEHQDCLPPLQSQQQVCFEIINLVSQLQPPTNQKIEFMQAVSEISSAVKKIWLSSPKSSAVLPSLAHIYAIMARSKLQSKLSNIHSFTLNSFRQSEAS